jgi:hypothetical protein
VEKVKMRILLWLENLLGNLMLSRKPLDKFAMYQADLLSLSVRSVKKRPFESDEDDYNSE